MRNSIKCLLALLVLTAVLVSPLGASAAVGTRHDVSLQSDATRTAAVSPQMTTARSMSPVNRAIAWLRTQQLADGSFSAGYGSTVGTTADVVTAVASTGQDVFSWQAAAGQPTVQDYLISQAASYVQGTNAGNAGKLLVAVVAANGDPRAFGGLDLVAATKGYDTGSGTFDAAGINQAWAILGLVAARETLPTGAVEALAAMQQADGGWDSGWGTDAGTTALALEALLAGGYADDGTSVLADGLAYLRAHQSASGGFFSTDAWGNTAADADSTAICVQALVALGENPLAAEWLVGGVSALHDLLTMQAASGGFEWQSGMGANLLSTAAAIPALIGQPLPLAGAGVAMWDALRYLATVQQANGSFENTLSSSAYALLALASADEYARLWNGTEGASLVDYLTGATAQITDAGLAGRYVAALAMAGENPYLVGNVNAVELLWQYYDVESGSFDTYGNVWNQVLAMWGLQAAGETVPAAAVNWLLAEQNADGGWGWGNGLGSDTNSTALAIQTLIVAGVAANDAHITAALDYLAGQQVEDAGFAWDKTSTWYTGSDSNSTALVIQALLAADPAGLDSWEWARVLTAADQISLTVYQPMDNLLSFQLPSGAFEWQSGDYGGANYLATVQAIPALAGVAFPWEHARMDAAQSALAWLKGQQNADGSFGGDDPVAATIQAVLAGVSLGEDVTSWCTAAGNPSALDYLASHVDDLATDAGSIGQLLAAVVVAGLDARSFGGADLLASLLNLGHATGQWSSEPGDQAWAMIGLAAAHYPVSAASVSALVAMQAEDGGWADSTAPGQDTYITALALQALAAAGVDADDAAVQAGLSYLKARQTASGGLAADAAASQADAQATIAAVQAVLALGGEPRADEWTVDGQSLLDGLMACQLTSGAFEVQSGAGADVPTTALAVPALLYEVNPLYGQDATTTTYVPLMMQTVVQ